MVNPNIGDLTYDTARYFRGELENKPCIKFNDVPRDTGMAKKGWGPHCLTSNVGPWNDIEAWQKDISIHHKGVPNRAKMPREGPGGDGSGYTDRPPCIKPERRPAAIDAAALKRRGSKDSSRRGSKASELGGVEGVLVGNLEGPSRPGSKASTASRDSAPPEPTKRETPLAALGVSTRDLRALEDWKRSRRKAPKKKPKPEGEVPVPAVSAYKPKNLG